MSLPSPIYLGCRKQVESRGGPVGEKGNHDPSVGRYLSDWCSVSEARILDWNACAGAFLTPR